MMSEAITWFSAFIAGTTAGLIPFFVARSRHNNALAWGALVGCIVLGVLGGAIIAAPACVVLTAVALMKSAANEKTSLKYWSIAVPAGALIWLTALGLVAASLPANFITGKITIPITLIAFFLGGYVASGVTWLANRETAKSESDDIAARISSIGDNTTSQSHGEK
jgi:hypothetical protein